MCVWTPIVLEEAGLAEAASVTPRWPLPEVWPVRIMAHHASLPYVPSSPVTKEEAKAEKWKPTLIMVKTVFGYGAPPTRPTPTTHTVLLWVRTRLPSPVRTLADHMVSWGSPSRPLMPSVRHSHAELSLKRLPRSSLGAGSVNCRPMQRSGRTG